MPNAKKRVLITGDSGLLGANLCYLWKDRFELLGLSRGNIHVQGVCHTSADVTDMGQVLPIVQAFRPDVIIHTAALVNVDGCENDPEMARQFNAFATRNMAACADMVGAHLIHISTDAFYLSKEHMLGREQDILMLKSEYARSKYEGEQYALEYDNSLVLRTNFYGYNLQEKFSFGEWILRDLKLNKTLTMTTDVSFSPIFVNDLEHVLDRAIATGLNGLYNAGCSGSISKYDFAIELRRVFGIETGEIIPITVQKLMFSAWRSTNMAMDNRRIIQDLAVDIPGPEACIDHFRQLYEQGYGSSLKARLSTSDIVD